MLPDVVRIAIELDREIDYSYDRIDKPVRVFLDIANTDVAPAVPAAINFDDSVVKTVRYGPRPANATRVVLDLEGAGRHSVFTLYNPFRVVVDIFRDDDMSGWAKAGWLVLTILLPFLGVFVYVVARGKNMGRREVAQARAQQAAFDDYIRQTAKGGEGRSTSVDELARLSEIRSRGDITDDEFRRAKELVLSGHGASAGTGAGPTAAGHR